MGCKCTEWLTQALFGQFEAQKTALEACGAVRCRGGVELSRNQFWSEVRPDAHRQTPFPCIHNEREGYSILKESKIRSMDKQVMYCWVVASRWQASWKRMPSALQWSGEASVC